MGYCLELGYADRVVENPAGGIEMPDFEVAKVRQFTGGSLVLIDPELGAINQALDIEPYEYGVDVSAEPTDFSTASPVDNDGLVDASIDITYNYTPRIEEITGIHLRELHASKGAEAAPTLMKLIAELGDDTDFDDYWNACDGNIKHLARTLLDWTFQHPDGLFYALA